MTRRCRDTHVQPAPVTPDTCDSHAQQVDKVKKECLFLSTSWRELRLEEEEEDEEKRGQRGDRRQEVVDGAGDMSGEGG